MNQNFAKKILVKPYDKLNASLIKTKTVNLGLRQKYQSRIQRFILSVYAS